jgi:class 3 adenylate cyclase
MGLKSDIAAYAAEAVQSKYEVTDAREVPSRASVTFGPTARKLFVRALYIDLRRSRDMLADFNKMMSLRAHKAFLYAVAKCVRAEGGEPRSFGGDSVLAFFPGDTAESAQQAVRAAMKIHFSLEQVVNPVLKAQYDHTLDFGIGVGQGTIYVGKSGIPGDQDFQDLIWMGWPVYRAVEFGEAASKPSCIWISDNVWKSIASAPALTVSNGSQIWSQGTVRTASGQYAVYKTEYHCRVN